MVSEMIVCIPDVLTSEELTKLRDEIAKLPFVDGKETAGQRAKRVKRNEQVSKDAAERRPLQELLLKALTRNRKFARASYAHRIRPPLLSRYRAGMAYGIHVDDAMMGPSNSRDRSDISVTIFISDPKDYEGGELVIHSPYGIQEVKLPAGSAVIYPSSSLHEVAEVKSGERVVAVTWVQSYVRDEKQREMLVDLTTIRDKLAGLAPDAKETDLAYRLHANLLRMWAEN